MLPNVVSLLRLALCPPIILLILKTRYILALELFAVACLCDYLDGYLARRLGACTALGALLDPICDKVFILTFYCLLMSLGACPAWFLGLLIAVSLLQGVGLGLLKLSPAFSKPESPPFFGALPLGKWNMALQFIWIGILIFDVLVLHHNEEVSAVNQWFRELGYVMLAGFQIAVFLRYFFHFRPELALHFRSHAHPA